MKRGKKQKGAKRVKRAEGVQAVVRREMMRVAEAKWAGPQLAGAAFGSIANAWTELDLIGATVGGVGPNDRVGLRCSIKNIHLHGVLAGGAGLGIADDLYNNFRIVCYIARRAGTGAAQTPLMTLGIDRDVAISRINVPGFDKMIWDQMIGLTNQPFGGAAAAPATRELNLYHEFKPPLEIAFNTAAAHTNNTQLYIAMISDSAAVPHPGFTLGYIQIRYTDI